MAIFSSILFLIVWSFSFGLSQFPSTFVRAAAVTWDGGGGDDDWCTDANWSGDVEPTTSDDVTIDTEISITTSGCVSEVKDLNFNSLTLGGTATTTLTLTANIGTGGDIILNDLGSIVQDNTNTQTITGTLTIGSGGILTHTDNSTSHAYEVDFSMTTLDVQSGGMIDVDGLGFDGGTTSGEGPGGGVNGTSGAGGAHGGDGGGASSGATGTGGTAYCDISNPVTLGSGGSGAVAGGAGGGLVILQASGTATINGTITADGTNGQITNDAAGAGGAININAASISGTPQSFSVRGGNGTGVHAGGGGGGCVLLGFTTTNSISPTANYVTTRGGTHTGFTKDGGAGLFYTKQTGTNGDLYLLIGGQNDVGSSQGVSSLTVDTMVLASSSRYIVPSGKTLIVNNTEPFVGGDGTGAAEIASGGTLTTPAGENFIISSTTLRIREGAIITNAATLDVTIAANGSMSMYDYTTSTNSFTLASLLVQSGGILTHASNTTTQAHIINLSLTSSTIMAGGSIDVDGKGYLGGNNGSGILGGSGPGGGTSIGGGGGHAGGGGGSWFGAGYGGSAYCVTSSPDTIGSGGAYGGNSAGIGGNGGGLIVMNISETFIIDGTIRTDGNTGTVGSAGGAGGGMNITAATIAGTPERISANGGNYLNVAGAGSGGCALFNYSSTSTITSSSISVVPGTQGGYGDAGSGNAAVVLSNLAPVAVFGTASQTSVGIVTVTSTISDANSDVTSLIIDYSLDGSTWVSSTLAVVSADVGAVTTSSGQIASIDTDVSNVVLTIQWNIEADVPDTDDTTVYLRVTPDDGTVSGNTVTTSVFSIDTADPTIPGDISFSSVATTSFSFGFPSTTSTDTNFLEYKIYYNTTTPVTTADIAFTSSTDVNLADASFNSQSTSETITNLNPNDVYYAVLYAYDSWGFSTSSSEVSTTTAANIPSNLASTAVTQGTIALSWGQNNNPNGTEYLVLETITNKTSGWLTDTTYTFSGLSAGTVYNFYVKARNSANVETSYTAGISVSTNNAGGGIPSAPPPPPHPPKDPICVTHPADCPVDEKNPSGIIIINSGDEFTHVSEVTISLDTEFVSEYAFSDTPDFSNQSFVPIVPSVSYMLSPGDGEKKVYARFRDDKGNTYDAYDVIILSAREDEDLEPSSVMMRISKKAYTYFSSTPGLQLTTPKLFSFENPFLISLSSRYVKNKAVEHLFDNVSSFYGTNFKFGFDVTQPSYPFCFFFYALEDTTRRSLCDTSGYVENRDYMINWDGEELVLYRDASLKKVASVPISAFDKKQNIIHTYSKLMFEQGNFSGFIDSLTKPIGKTTSVDGLLNVYTPLKYTNSNNVMLKFSGGAYDLVAIQTSFGKKEFSTNNRVYEPFDFEKQLSLGTEDGKYCVQAMFQDSTGVYEPSESVDCVIFDTGPPSANFDATVQKEISQIRVYGKSEPFVNIFLKKTYSSASLASQWIHTVGWTTFGTNANEQGEWFVDVPITDDGDYTFVVTATDAAGNNNESEKTLTIQGWDVVGCAGEGCTDEDTCDGDTCEESPIIDTDKDGIADDVDNCPFVFDPFQIDEDGDSIGDACDNDFIDTDKDGIVDDVDNCPFVFDPFQIDEDKDGIGDACDKDFIDTDKDGVVDNLDNCPLVANANQTDQDIDGKGDACDICVLDASDTCLLAEDVCVEETCKEKPIKDTDIDTDINLDTDADIDFDINLDTDADIDFDINIDTGIDLGADADIDFDIDTGMKADLGAGTDMFINTNKDDIFIVLNDCVFNPDKGCLFIGYVNGRVDQVVEGVRNYVKNLLYNTPLAIITKPLIDFAQNETVEEVNEEVVAPVVLTTIVANAAIGFQLPNVFAYLRYLFLQPLVLLRRRKQKKWGVIYNAYTKEPIDLATVRLIDENTGTIIHTETTDMQGRFFLMADEGTYKLVVQKNGFIGFSTYLKSKQEDSNYIHLYHGDSFVVSEQNSEINYNIPLDPTYIETATSSIVKDFTTYMFQKGIALIGLFLTIVSCIISPTWIIGGFLIIHILLYHMFSRFAQSVPKGKFGVVTDSHGNIIGEVMVRVFDATYNKLVASTVTDSFGRYAILVGPSTYYVLSQKEGVGIAQTDILDLSSKKTKGIGGLIAEDLELNV